MTATKKFVYAATLPQLLRCNFGAHCRNRSWLSSKPWKENSMTKYVLIDTETTGLFDMSQPSDAEGQPRMASLALIVWDSEYPETTTELDFLIRPDGWTMPPEAEAINGLSQAALEAHGVPVAEALDAYTDAILSGHIMTAYNAQYDGRVMRGELRRAGRDDMFEQTPNTCLMRSCMSAMKGRRKVGAKGFPKLSEAAEFFKVEHSEVHTAMGDARAALGILRALGGNLIPPKVHYAKDKPEVAA